MSGCIYIRTFDGDGAAKRLSPTKQMEKARLLAERHTIQIADHCVFSDHDAPGHLPPTSWADENEAGRPALDAMLDAIELGEVRTVLVARVERLGTDYTVLTNLCTVFKHYNVKVITEENENLLREDPSESFARSLMGHCLQLDTHAEQVRKQRLRERKIEEINRLKERLARLEAEVSDLSPTNLP
jgi:DNA invertase Pin-like site-specific DNA recombinase